MKTYFIIFCCLFLFSCSDSAKKENREYKNGVVYFDTSNSHFLNEKNGELFDKSRKLHSNKDYNGCLNILLKLKEEEPQNKLVLGSLGIVYLDLKEYDKSEKYLKGVTESHPDFLIIGSIFQSYIYRAKDLN